MVILQTITNKFYKGPEAGTLRNDIYLPLTKQIQENTPPKGYFRAESQSHHQLASRMKNTWGFSGTTNDQPYPSSVLNDQDILTTNRSF